MSIKVLLKEAQQANIKLSTSIQGFQDPAISTALENLPSVINKNLKHIQTLLTQEVLLKNTLQSEMSRISKLIEAKTGIIEEKGTRFLEKIQAVELLEGIYNSYLALYQYYYPQPKQTPIARWQDDRLRLEQQVVYKEKGIDEALKKVLTDLNKMAEEHFSVPNRCFISYAWAGSASSDEKWVQPFLKYLGTHLGQAGVNVSLDIKDNLMGKNLYQYMNRIKQSDCVIVVGTQALFQQHEAGVGGVCNQLVLINENRAQQQGKTLPILLSGCLGNALPPYFQMYNSVTDWRENSYITNLKRLLASIYDVGAENAEYQQLWEEFEQNYPILVTGFPEEAVHNQIALENALASQQKELDAQQAIELFGRVNEIQLNRLKINNLCLTDNITWEILIKCVKAKYMEGRQFKTIFGEAQKISHCYVNLAIVEEKEQREKEKFLTEGKYHQNLQEGEQSSKNKKSSKQVLEREAWLNSYEEIHGTKTPISPQDIHKPQKGKTLNRQLLLGRAGIGKSTLCQYLAYQWAKEGWWKNELFKLLVWVPLRQLTNENIYPTKGNAITLGKLFYEQYAQQLRGCLVSGKEREWVHLIDKLIEEHHSEILYVLDGFDEVAHVCQLDDSQATRQTEILNQLLKQERVVITSRPYYIDDYLNTQGIKIDRRLENIGFVDKDVQDYIQRYSWKTAEHQKELQSLVASNSMVRGITHVPINLALLCRYWNTQTLKEQNVISMTDLYEGLVGDLLYEYLGKQSGKGYIDFIDSTTSSILNNKQAQPVLQFLEKLAFLQMQEESLLISKERIAGLLEECQGKVENNEWKGFKSVLRAGLLVSPDEQEKCFEGRREHYFIHLTFQEFLAARYIARQFKQNDEPSGLFMQNHKYDLRYEITWRFVAGLLKNHEGAIERFFNSLLLEPRSLSGWYDFLLWIKCLEETQLTNNLNKTLKNNLIEEIRKVAQAALDWKAYISRKQFSKTFFEYLYLSPVVYKKLNILTQKAVKEARSILQWHLNLPTARLPEGYCVFKKIEGLLTDKDWNARSSALFALGQQQNLSGNILNKMASLLEDEHWYVRETALSALGQQSVLPVNVLDRMASLLSDKEWYVRKAALKALSNFPNLPASILEKMANLLEDEDKYIRCFALKALSNCSNLPVSILKKMMNLLKDKRWRIRRTALKALINYLNFPISIFVSLLIDKEKEVESLVEQDPPSQQSDLSDSILEKMVNLLSNEKNDVRSVVARYALAQQPNLPDGILEKMVSLLSDEDKYVRNSALNVLNQQPNLSISILEKMVNLLSNENKDVRNSTLDVLGQQLNLPISVLEKIMNLLEDKYEFVKRSVFYVLGEQPNLSVSILSRIINLVANKKQEYNPNDEEINFINQQLVSILHSQKLQSQLSSAPMLLSAVILENTFSSKNVVYFKNNQSPTICLGQQLKQIEIKDKKEFLQIFIEQHKLWLNNRNTEYLLTLKKEFEQITIA